LRQRAEEMIESGQPDALVDAIIRAHRPFAETLTGDLNLEVAMGNVATIEAYEEMRQAHLASRKDKVAVWMLPIAQSIVELGGEVT
jgi:hypothetical protein